LYKYIKTSMFKDAIKHLYYEARVIKKLSTVTVANREYIQHTRE